MPAPQSITNKGAYWLGRGLKILGNVLKVISRLLYFVVPWLRFTLPSDARPLLGKGNLANPRITRILWQTNYTNRVSLPVQLNYLCNRLLSASYRYCFMSDAEILEFVEVEFPGRIFNCYKRLAIGAAKADLWRLLVLYRYGGVYIDIDGHLAWPLGWTLRSNPSELFVKSKDYRFTNFFMASEPGNALILQLIEEAIRRIESPTTNNVYHLTGPGLMDDLFAEGVCSVARVEEVCMQGNFTNKFFQYIDKPGGDWVTAKKTISAVTPQ